MNLSFGTEPVRWWIIERWCQPVFMSDIPPENDPVWEASYDNDLECGKRTTRQVPPAFEYVFGRLYCSHISRSWSARCGYELGHDPTQHGAGLQVTRPGGYLACHLDYDRHPKLPDKRRALNVIVFLNPDWREEWGGALCLCNPMGEVVKRIYPAPGRLVAFECNDLSYHSVERITGPVERVTAAVYLLAQATGRETRQRAMFLPVREAKYRDYRFSLAPSTTA